MLGNRKAGHHPFGQLSFIPVMVLTMSYNLSLSLRLHIQTHSHTCTDSHIQTEHLKTQYKVAVLVLS